MARWRAVHRKMCVSPDVSSMTEWAQLLWARIIICADDFGRLAAEPEVLKATCHPMSPRPPEDFASAVREMLDREMVRLYRHGRRVYIEIRNWDEHQKPSGSLSKRTRSDFPGASDDGSEIVPDFPGSSRNVPEGSGKASEVPPLHEHGRDSRPTDSLPSVGSPPVGTGTPGGDPSPEDADGSPADPPRRKPRRPQQPDLLKPVVDALREDLRAALMEQGTDVSALGQDWRLKATGVLRGLLGGEPERAQRIRNVIEYLKAKNRLRSHPSCLQEGMAEWPRLLQAWNTTDDLIAQTPIAWRYKPLSPSQRGQLARPTEQWEQDEAGEWRQTAAAVGGPLPP